MRRCTGRTCSATTRPLYRNRGRLRAGGFKRLFIGAPLANYSLSAQTNASRNRSKIRARVEQLFAAQQTARRKRAGMHVA